MNKNNTTFEKRLAKSSKIKLQYPGHIPIMVECNKNSPIILSKNKYMVPKISTVGQFLIELRKNCSLPPEESIFIFCGKNNSLVPISSTIGDLYTAYKDPDGFLYIVIALENVFGTWNIITYTMDSVLTNVLYTSKNISSYFF